MSKTIHGVINGRTIQLADDPGVPNGQEVEVLVIPVPTSNSNWGDGIRRCAGALAEEWTEEDDRILEEIYQQRKVDTRPELL